MSSSSDTTATDPASTGPVVSPQACARCGGDAEHDFGDMWLCTDCYYIAGSTCAGVNVARPATGPGAAGDDDPGAVC